MADMKYPTNICDKPLGCLSDYQIRPWGLWQGSGNRWDASHWGWWLHYTFFAHTYTLTLENVALSLTGRSLLILFLEGCALVPRSYRLWWRLKKWNSRAHTGWWKGKSIILNLRASPTPYTSTTLGLAVPVRPRGIWSDEPLRDRWWCRNPEGWRGVWWLWW